VIPESRPPASGFGSRLAVGACVSPSPPSSGGRTRTDDPRIMIACRARSGSASLTLTRHRLGSRSYKRCRAVPCRTSRFEVRSHCLSHSGKAPGVGRALAIEPSGHLPEGHVSAAHARSKMGSCGTPLRRIDESCRQCLPTTPHLRPPKRSPFPLLILLLVASSGATAGYHGSTQRGC